VTVWRSAGLAGVAVGLALTLSSCAYLAEPPAGLDQADDFIALPVRAWLLRNDVRAITVAGCLVEPCTARVGVGVFEMTGAAASDIARAVADPERVRADILRRDREDRNPQRRSVETSVAVASVTIDGARGFTIRLSRSDGSRSAHGIALTRAGNSGTRVILAVADEASLALSAARQVAGAYLR
jgi:hypothetical protein